MQSVLQIALLILIGVALFGFLIFIHEFGHFFTAKLCKVRVLEFAIGMGPKILSFERGETRYSLRLLPIGGYCAMEGEDEKSDDPHAFGNRPVWQRMIVIVAGAIMNILMAVILMMCLRGGQELFATQQIARVPEGSPYAAGGLMPGDVITELNGYTVYSGEDLNFAFSLASVDAKESETVLLDFTVNRDGQPVHLEDIEVRTEDAGNGHRAIVLEFSVLGEQNAPWTLIKHSFSETFATARMVLESLKGMVTGRFGLGELAGPVGTAQAVSQVAGAGLERGFGDAVRNIVYMMAIIAVNLGIVNLLPLPALDGGRFVFLLIELVARRPVPARYERWVHAGGMIALLAFMVVITFSDIVRLVTGGSM